MLQNKKADDLFLGFCFLFLDHIFYIILVFYLILT